MTSFKFSISQKMLKFRKGILEKLKNRETFRALATSNFQELFARMAVRHGTFRICVLRTSHLESYRTSVPYFSSILKRIVPTYRTRTVTKKAYRTSVPYFLAKIDAHLNVPYRTAILAFNYSQLNRL